MTLLNDSEINFNVGYIGKRVQQKVHTGIFECNSRCKCNHKCNNRVVQNGKKTQATNFCGLPLISHPAKFCDFLEGLFVSITKTNVQTLILGTPLNFSIITYLESIEFKRWGGMFLEINNFPVIRWNIFSYMWYKDYLIFFVVI